MSATTTGAVAQSKNDIPWNKHVRQKKTPGDLAVDFVIVLAAGVFIFDVPFAGSPLLLFGLSLIFLIACLGMGLLVSTVSQTQQQAMQMAVL